MLAASSTVPNNEQKTPVSTPTPGNWFGVTEGIAAAKEAASLGNLEQTESILIELLEFAPVEVRAWKMLAKVQRRLGHIEAGINSAKRALQLQNNSVSEEPLASYTLARLLRAQGEHDQARQMLDLLIEQQPDNAELKATRQQWDMENIA